MTATEVRDELLAAFAALTRHKPVVLAGKFRVTLVTPDDYIPGDTLRLEASFGKRNTSMPVPGDVLSWNVDQFRSQVAKPLARQLLESA